MILPERDKLGTLIITLVDIDAQLAVVFVAQKLRQSFQVGWTPVSVSYSFLHLLVRCHSFPGFFIVRGTNSQTGLRILVGASPRQPARFMVQRATRVDGLAVLARAKALGCHSWVTVVRCLCHLETLTLRGGTTQNLLIPAWRRTSLLPHLQYAFPR